LLHDDFFLKVDVGAGIAVKLSATSRSDFSSLLNLVAVVDVTKRNRPLPTTDAEMNAFQIHCGSTGLRYLLDSNIGGRTIHSKFPRLSEYDFLEEGRLYLLQ
jgi:hypothetical protein